MTTADSFLIFENWLEEVAPHVATSFISADLLALSLLSADRVALSLMAADTV
jgi:hypothetical protein